MPKTKNPDQDISDEIMALLAPEGDVNADNSQQLGCNSKSSDVKTLEKAVAAAKKVEQLREQLAILVSTGKSKEAVGVQLTHEKVKSLSDKEVEKLALRYETYVGSKTTDSLISSGIYLVSKLVGMAVEIDDVEAYQRELKEDYIIGHELANLAGNLAFTCGRYLALANAALITAKHVNFSKGVDLVETHRVGEISSSRGSEEFSEHSSAVSEKVPSNGEQMLTNSE